MMIIQIKYNDTNNKVGNNIINNNIMNNNNMNAE